MAAVNNIHAVGKPVTLTGGEAVVTASTGLIETELVVSQQGGGRVGGALRKAHKKVIPDRLRTSQG
ncbi:hypothetical protein [Marinobacter sp. X15-166B]|uniref:hypothetical protein n=1 Tax=Marinobacter sp. X15-166B TaxID=1897620 RepID=UPI00085CBDA3|nr:hypothetical protein [Marinobacter sp. X15-166B]OEY66029.1 hypothetical protein BG841_05860 [Marinobacter sp. X15-166B]